ncbi:MAG: PKD domain-containing protein [Nitrosopumilus sp.]
MLTLFAVVSLLTISSVGSSFAEETVNVEEEKMIILIGSESFDPDNDDITFLWEQTSGEPVTLTANDVPEPQFLAPSVNNGFTETLGFTLTVSDPFGGVSQESIQIIVNPINHAPTVNAGKDKIVFPSVNAITLFANAHDADDDVLAYSWKQLGGQTAAVEDMTIKHLTIDSSQLDFTDFTPLTFEVTVDDGFGGTDTDTVDVFLSTFSSDNPSLAVDAGPIQVVDEGTRVTLLGSGQEINNKPITFSWAQHLGPVVSLTSTIAPTPTFTAPNIDDDEAIVLSFVLTGYVPGSGYAQDTAIVKVLPVNHPPIADAGPDQTVREFSRVKLVGEGSDPDGDRITSSWSQIAGPEVLYNQFSTELSFTSPDVATDETLNLEFEFRVRDQHGAVSTDTAVISVNAINHPPSANAGPDQTVREGTDVQLNGSGFDSDGDELTYSWTQKSGAQVEITQTGTSLAFEAPTGLPNKTMVLVFELTVADSFGGSDSDAASVMVVANNSGPSANAGPDQEVDENAMTTLTCVGSDPEGDALSYSWRQVSGPTVEMINPNSSILTFVAPGVVETTTLEFECTVTDGQLSSSDSVMVTINNLLNLDIVADAGDDRIVNENRTITLDGSRSYDPENQPLKYSWIQLDGESVSLNDANSVTPTFTSPGVQNGEIKVLTFELTVFDDNDRSDYDTVTITVDPINAPPEAAVTAKQLP